MWRIKNWNEHYENHKSRAIDEARWVPIPNKQDGDGYLALVTPETGREQYGCFVAIVLLASKCSPRGDLRQSNGIPHTPETMSRKTAFPPRVVHETLHRCARPDVDWVEWVEDPADPTDTLFPEKPPNHQTTGGRRPSAFQEDGRAKPLPHGNGNGITPHPPAGASAEFPCIDGRWTVPAALLRSLQERHPKLDVEAELAAARAKLMEIADCRKQCRQMETFIWNWMKFAQRDHDRGAVKPDNTDRTICASSSRLGKADRVRKMLEEQK